MTTDAISKKLADVLRPRLRFLAADAPIPPDASLGSLGLDSMATINLLLDLEQAFGVSIPDEMLSAETFETFQNMESTFRPLFEQAG